MGEGCSAMDAYTGSKTTWDSPRPASFHNPTASISDQSVGCPLVYDAEGTPRFYLLLVPLALVTFLVVCLWYNRPRINNRALDRPTIHLQMIILDAQDEVSEPSRLPRLSELNLS